MQHYKLIRIFNRHQINAGTMGDYPLSFKKKFKEWFMKYRESRLYQLYNLITNTKGFENWKMDFSMESLKILDSFLAQSIEKERRSDSEIEKRRAIIPSVYFSSVYYYTFTDRCFSLMFDIGLYLGETFVIRNGLYWEQYNPKSKNVFSGSMIIPYRKQPKPGYSFAMNPFLIVAVIMSRLSSNSAEENPLYTMYNRYLEHIDKSELDVYGDSIFD